MYPDVTREYLGPAGSTRVDAVQLKKKKKNTLNCPSEVHKK